MNVRRAALTAWILFQLAVIGVYLEVQGVELKYRLAETGRKLHAATLERRTLQAGLESARRPDELARRALALEKKSTAVPRRR